MRIAASFFVAALALLALAATPTLAQGLYTAPGNYVAGNIGVAFGGSAHGSISDPIHGEFSGDFTPDAGVFASVSVGHAFPNGFAVEAEGIYTQNFIDTAHQDVAVGVGLNVQTQMWGGMANAFYAFPPVQQFTPYIGGGVGYGNAQYRIRDSDDNQGGFIWQVRAGLSYPLGPDQSVDFGYRWLEEPQFNKTFLADTGSGPVPVTIKAQTKMNVLYVGWRVRF
jgi:opacity protein-like surface antigen